MFPLYFLYDCFLMWTVQKIVKPFVKTWSEKGKSQKGQIWCWYKKLNSAPRCICNCKIISVLWSRVKQALLFTQKTLPESGCWVLNRLIWIRRARCFLNYTYVFRKYKFRMACHVHVMDRKSCRNKRRKISRSQTTWVTWHKKRTAQWRVTAASEVSVLHLK